MRWFLSSVPFSYLNNHEYHLTIMMIKLFAFQSSRVMTWSGYRNRARFLEKTVKQRCCRRAVRTAPESSMRGLAQEVCPGHGFKITCCFFLRGGAGEAWKLEGLCREQKAVLCWMCSVAKGGKVWVLWQQRTWFWCWLWTHFLPTCCNNMPSSPQSLWLGVCSKSGPQGGWEQELIYV